jgi:hypothetical protein
MTSILDVQPGHILCLEHEDTYLYAELIQAIPQNERVWVRPLMLAVSPSSFGASAVCDETQPQPFLYDLREGSDLLCAAILFRAALDTEVLPLLAQLGHFKALSDGDRTAHHHLHGFIRQVCQFRSNTL